MTAEQRSITASDYIKENFEPRDRIALLILNRETGESVQRITTAEKASSPEFQAWLRHRNATGDEIFIGMNPVKQDSRSRTKEDIREIRHVYLDLDEEARANLQAIRAAGDVPTPNFVLDTSPGKHQVVWRVQGFDTEHAESLLRALASQFGGDPAATDVSRLLRLAGFVNRKYNEAFVVRVHHEADAVYHWQDFAVQEGLPESPRHLADSQNGSRDLTRGYRSQSEADWAYAKRALARGDHPERVVRQIADYRAEDKADPLYYAKLTVTKAQTELRAKENSPDAGMANAEHSSRGMP